MSAIPLVMCVMLARGEVQADGLNPLFEAIRFVETGGRSPAREAVGDDGRSIGPYQISYAYWRDSGAGGEWKKCKNRAFAEKVMLRYWKRYCPEALRRTDFEVLARIHNGGPTGHRKPTTLAYWKMVRRQL